MKKNFSRLFLKLFLPYMSILVIVFIFISFGYRTAFREIENNAIKMQSAYLQQSKSVLDRRFNETIDATRQIRSISSIDGFKDLSHEEVEEAYIKAINLLGDLEDLWFRNDIIKGYFVIFKNSGVIANPLGLYYYDQLNEDALVIEGVSYEELWQEIFDDFYIGEIMHSGEMSVHKAKTHGISFVISLGYNYDESDGVVYLIMDGNMLKENMIGFGETFKGNFFILDENDQILLSLNEEYGLTMDGQLDKEVIEEEAVVLQDKSEAIPYTYMLIQPKEMVFHDIEAMRKNINLLGIAMILVGFIASIFWARKNSLPVAQLMKKNESLTERVNTHIPHLRTTFLERWLKGEYRNYEEITNVAELLNTDYYGEHYCVLVIDYDEHIDILNDSGNKELQQLEMKRVEIKDALNCGGFDPMYIHDIDHDKLAVIFIDKDGDYDQFKALISEQSKRCKSLLNKLNFVDIHYGIGNIYNDMLDVAISLVNALDALTVSVGRGEGCVMWYDSIEHNCETYYYPLEIETRLFNCVRAGESDMVVQIIREVFSKNLIERNLSSVLMNALIFDVWGTLNKVRDRSFDRGSEVSMLIDKAYEKMLSTSDLEKIQLFKQTIIAVSDYYKEERTKRQDNIMTGINDYIYDNLGDPDFGLQTVADKYKISYKYVSKLFKEYNDSKFSDYLQEVRMKEIEKLLLETSLPVREIYTRCGYYSGNTFGKAFKRRNGVSASIFRERGGI